MKIAIGSDHGGFNLKNTVMEHLKEQGYEFNDFPILPSRLPKKSPQENMTAGF